MSGPKLPTAKQQLIDPVTLQMNATWYRFFLDVFNQASGTASTVADNEIAPSEPGVVDMLSEMAKALDGLASLPVPAYPQDIASLRANDIGLSTATFLTVTPTSIVADTLTEILFTTSQSDDQRVSLSGGRITGAPTPQLSLSASCLMVTDGAADLDIFWQATDTAGNAYVPAGTSVATDQLPSQAFVKCNAAGRFLIPSPRGFSLDTLLANGQIRLFVKTPLLAPTINITACSVRLELTSG